MFYAVCNYAHENVKETSWKNSSKIEKSYTHAKTLNKTAQCAKCEKKIANFFHVCIRWLTVVANFDFCCHCACNAVSPLSIPLPSCCADTSSSSPRTCQRHHMCTKWSPSSTPAGTSSISLNLFDAIQIDFTFWFIVENFVK